MSDTKQELTPEELNDVVGGTGGSKHRLWMWGKTGCEVYQIQKGDTLYKLAQTYDTTVGKLMELNEGLITDMNDITAGYYIYVPAK